MADSEASIVRDLIREFESLAAASRSAGNTDPSLIPRFQAIAVGLGPYIDSFPAASNAVREINLYIGLIEQKSSAGIKSGTASAGVIQGEGSNARDEGATTQNPPGATLVVKQEDINRPVDIGPAPATTTGTNADKTETSEDVPGDKPTPDKLPNGSAPVTPASTSNGASATPGQNTGGLQPSGQSQATQTYIYRAKEVTHIFDRGRFTQELVGSLIVFPYPPGEEKKKDATQAKNDDAAQGDSQTQTQTALRRDPAPKTNLSPKIASEKLGTNVNAGKSNTLANALTLPPTSGGQPVAPRTFAEDVAQRKQTIITPQQINREP